MLLGGVVGNVLSSPYINALQKPVAIKSRATETSGFIRLRFPAPIPLFEFFFYSNSRIRLVPYELFKFDCNQSSYSTLILDSSFSVSSYLSPSPDSDFPIFPTPISESDFGV